MQIVDSEAEEPLAINILPMIDVIFAILAFFIISTLSLTRAEGFPVDLPEAKTSQPQQKASITITVDGSGDISVNKTPVALDQLAEVVRSQVDSRQAVLVTVQAAKTIDYGRVIAVMDKLRTVEGASLGMATQQPPAKADR